MMMNVELNTGFARRLLGFEHPHIDIGHEEFALRVSFQPVWMQPKVRIVFEIVSTKDQSLVAGRIVSPPMDIDDTITLSDVKNLFTITMQTS